MVYRPKNIFHTNLENKEIHKPSGENMFLCVVKTWSMVACHFMFVTLLMAVNTQTIIHSYEMDNLHPNISFLNIHCQNMELAKQIWKLIFSIYSKFNLSEAQKELKANHCQSLADRGYDTIVCDFHHKPSYPIIPTEQ